VDISSLVDTWLLLKDIELGGERNRALYILKSRGMKHSNQVREFLMTEKGVDLLDVYVGPEGVLTGSSRLSQESRERAASVTRQQEAAAKQRELRRKREALEARIAALRKEFEVESEEANVLADQSSAREETLTADRERMGRKRGADSGEVSGGSGRPRVHRRGSK
jgi:circadian clock protein KaiC